MGGRGSAGVGGGGEKKKTYKEKHTRRGEFRAGKPFTTPSH
jgi:hypothetical protein